MELGSAQARGTRTLKLTARPKSASIQWGMDRSLCGTLVCSKIGSCAPLARVRLAIRAWERLPKASGVHGIPHNRYFWCSEHQKYRLRGIQYQSPQKPSAASLMPWSNTCRGGLPILLQTRVWWSLKWENGHHSVTNLPLIVLITRTQSLDSIAVASRRLENLDFQNFRIDFRAFWMLKSTELCPKQITNTISALQTARKITKIHFLERKHNTFWSRIPIFQTFAWGCDCQYGRGRV